MNWEWKEERESGNREEPVSKVWPAFGYSSPTHQYASLHSPFHPIYRKKKCNYACVKIFAITTSQDYISKTIIDCIDSNLYSSNLRIIGCIDQQGRADRLLISIPSHNYVEN